MPRGRLLEQCIDVPVPWLLVVAVRQEDGVGSNTRQMVSNDFCVSRVVGWFPPSASFESRRNSRVLSGSPKIRQLARCSICRTSALRSSVEGTALWEQSAVQKPQLNLLRTNSNGARAQKTTPEQVTTRRQRKLMLGHSLPDGGW